ncbi:ribonuclease III [Streptococcaceae bacterium ESL0729]|nr:ribonuclease III [Streptococcaceae bacterium ESL0729]
MNNIEELNLELQEKYGINFTNLKLLKQAFTHSSYANEQRLPKASNNERLEFLGDAVLGLTISEFLFKKYEDRPEGELSKMRSNIVRTESLANFARKCNFDKYLLLGHGEEKSGGRNRDTNLENLFESFLGALLLDENFKAAEAFIYQVIIPTIQSGEFEKIVDFKTSLQEALQANGDVDISYQVVKESGPAHERVFEVTVFLNGDEIGHGLGKSKKNAEQAAAKNALESNDNLVLETSIINQKKED